MDTADIVANTIAFVALLVAIGAGLLNYRYTKGTFAATYHPDLQQCLGGSTSGTMTPEGIRNQQTPLTLTITNLSTTTAVADVTVMLLLSVTGNDTKGKERQLGLRFGNSGRPKQFQPEVEFRKQQVNLITPQGTAKLDLDNHLEADLCDLWIRKQGEEDELERALEIEPMSRTRPPRIYYLSDTLISLPPHVRASIKYRPSILNAKPLINQKTYRVIPQYTLESTSPRERVATLTGWTFQD